MNLREQKKQRTVLLVNDNIFFVTINKRNADLKKGGKYVNFYT